MRPTTPASERRGGARRRALTLASLAAALHLGGCAARTSEVGSAAAEMSDAAADACTSLVPAAAGGASPSGEVLALRWLGAANFELAHGRTVLLLDAYYDRGPRARPAGLSPGEVTRADAILVGHAHFDHVADAAEVARKTGALVVGASTVVDVVRRAGVPAAQTRVVTGRGGEVLRFPGFTVEPVRARHSVLSPEVMAKFREALAAADPATPAERAAEDSIQNRGTWDPTVATEGTMAYLITLDRGFRLIYLDSAGPITDELRALMRRIRSTDAAIVAYQGQYVADLQVASTLPLVELFRPALYLPSHHDEISGVFVDVGVEPLFMAIRERLPGTRTLAPLYRDPICLPVTHTEP